MAYTKKEPAKKPAKKPVKKKEPAKKKVKFVVKKKPTASHTMPDGTVMSGKTHPKPAKKVKFKVVASKLPLNTRLTEYMTQMSGKWDDKVYQLHDTKAEYDKEYRKTLVELKKYVKRVEKIKGGKKIIQLANSAKDYAFYGDKGNVEQSTLRMYYKRFEKNDMNDFDKDFLDNINRLKKVERDHLDGTSKKRGFAKSSDKARGALDL